MSMQFIDIFFDAKPTETMHHSKVDCLYALSRVKNSKGIYWHAHVTKAQYDWRISNGKQCWTWKDIQANSKMVKTVKDKNNNDKKCPEHVFSDAIMDPKDKVKITPDKEQTIIVYSNYDKNGVGVP